MPRVGFEPTTSAGERPQTYTLDRAATGTDNYIIYKTNCKVASININSKEINKTLI